MRGKLILFCKFSCVFYVFFYLLHFVFVVNCNACKSNEFRLLTVGWLCGLGLFVLTFSWWNIVVVVFFGAIGAGPLVVAHELTMQRYWKDDCYAECYYQ